MASQELYDIFQRVNRQIRRNLAQSEGMAQMTTPPLSPGQERLLRMLYHHGGFSQKELAAKMQMRPASLSEVLKKLAEKQLIFSQGDPNDGRKNQYFLTESGKKRTKEIREIRRNQGSGIFEALNDEEKAQLTALLTKVANSYQEKSENS